MASLLVQHKATLLHDVLWMKKMNINEMNMNENNTGVIFRSSIFI